MGRILRTRWVSSLVFAFLLVAAPRADAATNKFFTGDSSDAEWDYSAKANDAVWVPAQQHKTPTLLLKKSLLLQGALSLETDARQLNIACGDAPAMTLPIARGNVTLSFEREDDRPSLKIGGQENPRLRGPWIAIAGDKSDTLVLELTGATFATVHFPDAPPDLASPVAASQPTGVGGAKADVPSAALLSQPAVARDMLQRAQPAIFQVNTFDAAGHAFGSGTGFVIAANGYAVTNFHVIRGVSTAQAVLARDAKATPFPLELYAVEPEFDLALLKLPATAGPFTPLQLAKADPSGGDECWALGYPEGVGYTINKGVVNGVRDFSKLPAEFHEVFEHYSSKSRWIQTDCTLNHGNSGGPLINARGEDIGIDTWYWPDGNNMYFALSSQHIKDLLQNIPAKPVTFAIAAEKYKPDPVAQTAITGELPKLNIATTFTAAHLDATARAIPTAISHRCTRCSGTGSISHQVQTGREVRGAFSVPTYSTTTERCSACNGTGMERSSDEAIERLADNLVRQIATVDPKDKDATKALGDAYKVLTQAIIGDSKTWIKLSADARGLIAQQKLPPQTPVVVRAELVGIVPSPDGQGQMYVAIVTGTDQTLYLRNAVTAEDAKPGASVLMGGLIAGAAEMRDKRRVVVLQNGFLVAPVIPHDWTWWWSEGESRTITRVR